MNKQPRPKCAQCGARLAKFYETELAQAGETRDDFIKRVAGGDVTRLSAFKPVNHWSYSAYARVWHGKYGSRCRESAFCSRRCELTWFRHFRPKPDADTVHLVLTVDAGGRGPTMPQDVADTLVKLAKDLQKSADLSERRDIFGGNGKVKGTLQFHAHSES
jgi:hypothetical protein